MGTPRPLATVGDGDFAARAADMVEAVVDAVHDKAIRPAIIAARAVVFGLIIATMGVVVAVAAAIALVRLLDVYAFGDRVWASDALLGAVCCLAGAVAWAKRHPVGVDR